MPERGFDAHRPRPRTHRGRGSPRETHPKDPPDDARGQGCEHHADATLDTLARDAGSQSPAAATTYPVQAVQRASPVRASYGAEGFLPTPVRSRNGRTPRRTKMATAAMAHLRDQVRGEIITPEDAAYDDA